LQWQRRIVQRCPDHQADDEQHREYRQPGRHEPFPFAGACVAGQLKGNAIADVYLAERCGKAISYGDVRVHLRILKPCLDRGPIVEAEEEMLEACSLTEPDRGPIPRCAAGKTVQFHHPMFEILFVAGPDGPAGDNGGGLVWIDRHGGENI